MGNFWTAMAMPALNDGKSGWALIGRLLLWFLVLRSILNLLMLAVPHPFGGYSALPPDSLSMLYLRFGQNLTPLVAAVAAIALAFWPSFRTVGFRAALGLRSYPQQWLLWAFLGTFVYLAAAFWPLMSVRPEIPGGRDPIIDLTGIEIGHVVGFAAAALISAVAEVLLRGAVQPALMRVMAAWPAIAVTAVLVLPLGLALLALPLPGPFLTILSIYAIQLFFGWIRYRSGSLWPSLVMHALAGGLIGSLNFN